MLVVTTPEGYPHSEIQQNCKMGAKFKSFPFLFQSLARKQIPGGTQLVTQTLQIDPNEGTCFSGAATAIPGTRW